MLPEHHALVEGFDLLHDQVVSFWQAVIRGLNQLDAAHEVLVDGKPAAIVVEITDEYVLLKLADSG